MKHIFYMLGYPSKSLWFFYPPNTKDFAEWRFINKIYEVVK